MIFWPLLIRSLMLIPLSLLLIFNFNETNEFMNEIFELLHLSKMRFDVTDEEFRIQLFCLTFYLGVLYLLNCTSKHFCTITGYIQLALSLSWFTFIQMKIIPSAWYLFVADHVLIGMWCLQQANNAPIYDETNRIYWSVVLNSLFSMFMFVIGIGYTTFARSSGLYPAAYFNSSKDIQLLDNLYMLWLFFVCIICCNVRLFARNLAIALSCLCVLMYYLMSQNIIKTDYTYLAVNGGFAFLIIIELLSFSSHTKLKAY